jgi:hypothetical protein
MVLREDAEGGAAVKDDVTRKDGAGVGDGFELAWVAGILKEGASTGVAGDNGSKGGSWTEEAAEEEVASLMLGAD